MNGDEFDDRVAALEEHIVTEKRTAEDYLSRAEQAVAEGNHREARWCLTMAKIRSGIEAIKADREGDDDA